MKMKRQHIFAAIIIIAVGVNLFAPLFARALEQEAKQSPQQTSASKSIQVINEKQESSLVSAGSNSRDAEMWDRMMDTFEINFQFLQWIVLIIVGIGAFFGFKSLKEFADLRKEFKEKLEKHKNELVQKHKEELRKSMETKKDEIENIVKSAQAKLEVRNNKILIISSGERNIKEKEIKAIEGLNNNFEIFDVNEKNIGEMKNAIKEKNPDIIIFDPDTLGIEKRGLCKDKIFTDIANVAVGIDGGEIPIVVYMKNLIRFDDSLLETHLSSAANSPFTLASWTYTMLKVMSLKDKK